MGLVGFPNAGKSTLLSVVSAAKPKIDNYPFTTLEPNLGIVEYREGKSFVMADIPGIIEGASEGRGLGLRFLKHIERNSLLLFVIPADSKDIKEEYYILLNELKKYNPEMLDKSHILAISKSDMLDEELMDAITEELPDLPYVFISSVTGFGIQHLKDVLWRELNSRIISQLQYHARVSYIVILISLSLNSNLKRILKTRMMMICFMMKMIFRYEETSSVYKFTSV